MSTDNITIGRNPELTLAVINGLYKRQKQQKSWQKKLKVFALLKKLIKL